MPLLTSLLENYGITWKDLSARHALGSFENLHRPDGDKGFQAIVERLRKAVANKEKTVLYGDYDVDGLCATAILKSALDEKGLNPGFFIPSRYHEGYGLHKERVEQMAKKDYRLLIALDNGVSAYESIQEAKNLGMEVLVIDHHEYTNPLPEADIFFHQKLNGFLDYNCSAASLSYFVASALLGRDDPYLASLAGLAVFSDMMPMKGNNLIFAKIAREMMNRYRFDNFAFLTAFPISYDDINFNIIPALNSPGRFSMDVKATNKACYFLLAEKDKSRSKALADFLLTTNKQRKAAVQNVRVEGQQTLTTENGECLVYDGLSGLSGLIANRFLKTGKKSVAALCQDEKDSDCYVGSMRSEIPFLVEFLQENKNLFLHSGGHPQACGFTIRKKDYFRFATAFLGRVEKECLESSEKSYFPKTIPITFADLNEESFKVLSLFEPFGTDFPAPVFSLTCSWAEVKTASPKCVIAQVDEKGGRVVYFGNGNLLDKNKDRLIFIGHLRRGLYNGVRHFELVADTVLEE